MIIMNAPVSAYNGEQAFWINGKRKIHLGAGFPKGKWVWDGFGTYSYRVTQSG
jgi:hypothetical protein